MTASFLTLPCLGALFLSASLLAGCYTSTDLLEPASVDMLVPVGALGIGTATVRISPDGTRLVTTHHNDQATVWDLATLTKVRVLDYPHTSSVAEFSPDGSIIATGGKNRGGASRIELWDAETGVRIATLADGFGDWTAIDFSADGTRLIAAGPESAASLWDIDSRKVLARLFAGIDRRFRSLHLMENGSTYLGYMVLRSCDTSVDEKGRILDFGTGIWNFGASAIAVTPDESRAIAVGEGYAEIGIADVKTGANLGRMFQRQDSIPAMREIAISHDGRIFATGDEAGSIRIWRVSNGELLAEVDAEVGPRVISLSFGPGNLLAASGFNNTRIWRVEDVP